MSRLMSALCGLAANNRERESCSDVRIIRRLRQRCYQITRRFLAHVWQIVCIIDETIIFETDALQV